MVMPLVTDKEGLTEQWLGATPTGEGQSAYGQSGEGALTPNSPAPEGLAGALLRAINDIGDSDGLKVWTNDGPPARVVVDEMDWFEGDHRSLKDAVESIVEDPEHVLWQNEGGAPEGEDWSQVWPSESTGTVEEQTDKTLPPASMPVPDQSDVIAIDLNGTLATGRGPDPRAWGLPTYGAAEAMRYLKDRGYRLFVNSVVGDVGAIDGWLRDNGLRDYFEGINVSPAQPPGANPGKQNAAAYVDDRAVPFRGNWRETIGDLFLCDALTKSMGGRLRLRPVGKSADCGPGCPCTPCQDEIQSDYGLSEEQDKGRGQPCKQGETASRTGCIPRARPAAGARRGPAPKVEDVAAKVRQILGAKNYDPEGLKDLKDHLLSMRVVDITELKRHLGLSASGRKAELAKKVAERALEKLKKENEDADRTEPSPFGGKPGRGRGRRGDGEVDGGNGEGMAPETGGPGDEAAGGEGPDEGESAGDESAEDISEVQQRILGRIGRYKEVMKKKGMDAQAEWMDQLAESINDLGVEGALASLGEEKQGRGPDEPVQYVGAYDDIVGGVDKDSLFVKKYLESAGIQLAGATVDPNLSVISGWSKANITAQGRVVPETPGGYVPTDQTFTNKLEESQALPGLESSEDIHKVVGAKVTNFTPEVVAKLDAKYGKGSWIVKSYGEEAYAGFGIFFPQRVQQIQANAKALMKDTKSGLKRFGFQIAKDESGKVVGVTKGGKTHNVGTPEYAALGKTVQRLGRQAVQASHAESGASLPQNPVDSLKNDYMIDFTRDESGVPTGITNADGKQYKFDDPKIKEVEDVDGGAVGYAIHRAQEADQWRREGYNTEPKFMVQPAFKAVGVSDYDRAMGNTWETAKEGRVHVVTRGGKASAVPFATLVGRGDDLPAVFQSEDSKEMEKAVEEAINQLPESERAGQLYAPDVMKTKDGWKVIELNPSAAGGGSDWLGRNPFVIDALVSHLTGREPQHVKFVRDLMRKEGVKLPASGGQLPGGKSYARPFGGTVRALPL